MVLSGVWRGVAATVLVLTIAACDAVPVQALRPGSRVWVITVENSSDRPAVLVVAKDTMPIGEQVGEAQPATVPAGRTVDVTFAVPSEGLDWAVFVNPGPNIGPLITARDVPPGRSGRLPLTITVNRDGNLRVSVPNEPGWFGN